MSSRYFWAWVTAWIGLVAAPSSSALTVVIDGVKHTGSTVTITSGSTGGGGTTDPVPGNNGGGGNPPPDGGNGDTGTNPPSGGSACSGDVKLYQAALPGGFKQYNFGRGEGYAFSFQVSPGERGIISYGASTRRGNGYRSKLATISTCPGDFSFQTGACARDGVNEGGIYVGAGNLPGYYCSLTPNQTYYFNIRNYNSSGQDSCAGNENCGFSLNANWR